MAKDYKELPKVRDSISYIYVEHCRIEQDSLSVSIVRKNEKVPIPISATTTLLIGPGTSITHAAIKTMSENGCSAIWCGEDMQRMYSFGSTETRSAKNILNQARLCMDPDLHLEVVKRMYEIRFSKLPEGEYTIQQLRGMEGVRVKEAYKIASKLSGVEWTGRNYKKNEWEETDDINRALSQANAILYSVCQGVIVSLGFSTALGFVHTGKSLSFVYDIADIYKVETTIPAAFEAVKESKFYGDLNGILRKKCREKIVDANVMKRIPKDIAKIFNFSESEHESDDEAGELWDKEGNASGGKNYGGDN